MSQLCLHSHLSVNEGTCIILNILQKISRNLPELSQHGDIAPYREGSADDAYLLVSHTFIFTVIWLL